MQKLRKRTWMGRLAAAVMAAAVLVLAGAFVSLADEGGDTTRFVSGTKVNGVGVGGLTVDEAKARIEGFMPVNTISPSGREADVRKP